MKILLLSDATMNRNAGGLSQTLYNIFLFAEPQDFLCVTSEKAVLSVAPSEPFTERYLTYRFDNIINIPKNRLAKYVRPFINWVNFSFNNFKSFRSVKKQIAAFAPDVVVSCPKNNIGLFMHFKLLTGSGIKKIFPYFMDDWMNKSNINWFGGNTNGFAKRMLSENPSWLMISDGLSNILERRYHLTPARVLEVHNPVNLSDAPDAASPDTENFTLAYAGSLWPMHFDSFHAVAKAVHELSSEMKIRLVLYSAENFWNHYREVLEPLGVIYGGSIPYQQIHQKLSEANALLLCSSFTEKWLTHTEGSLQTKVTDYLKSKRVVISCGPDYSANNIFLKKHNCGICIELNDIAFIKTKLLEITKNTEQMQVLVDNGWEVLKDEFTFTKVHDKVERFISS